MKKAGKLSLLPVLALALSLGLTASVWAQPMGKGMGQGAGMMNLTPEQAGKIFDLKEKMHTDTAGLRRQIMVKPAALEGRTGPSVRSRPEPRMARRG